MNLQERLKEQVVSITPENSFIAPLVSIEPKQSNDIVPSFAISLPEAKQRLELLQEFVKEMMIPGQDYGIVPGVSKPSLFKPGAEKLTDIFGFSKQVEILYRTEDWENGLFNYEVKVSLINKRNQLVEAEGIGCCNSKEKRYRSQDPYNVVNTVLKMAKKRALIDAVLSATRSSGLFTQDVEDLDISERWDRSPQAQATRTVRGAKPGSLPVAEITQPQLRKVQVLAEAIGMTPHQLQALIQDMFRVNHASRLSKNQASALIQHLLSLQ
jgi:hypothetical protein